MPSLLASLQSAASSLGTFERALSAVQNNVTNASTPGYARQIVDLVSLNFQPELNLTGGVGVSDNVSSRSLFAEQAVRGQLERYGYYAQVTSSLSQVEPVFDIAAGAGLSATLSRLYSAFSHLSVSPNDISSRENVIERAKAVAGSFNTTAASLARSAAGNRRELRSALEDINRLGEVIAGLNREIEQDHRRLSDAGLDARLNAALEELSELVDFSALREANGTVTVLAGGQVPMVMGADTYAIEADFSGATVEVLDYTGAAVTSKIREGRLAGLLEVANSLIPSYSADLDALALAFGTRVNEVLAAGVDLNGQTPAVDLFVNQASAATIAVSAITAEQIAAAYPGAPGGNANALDLASLAELKEINNQSFTEFFGQIGGRLGRSLSAARDDQHTQSLLVAQARTLREELSGVNLDEEAASLIQYQRAYQAAAQMITVLNELTENVFTMMR
jgi:flagellar hook-associated protein 1 FlgK